MKSLLLSVVGVVATGLILPAVAADMPTKGYLKAPAAAVNWTGCYLGAEGGGNWGRTGSTSTGNPGNVPAGTLITGNFDLTGAIAGGTIGCNYQAGNWVFGIENDLSWTNKSGTANDLLPFNTATSNRIEEKWLDTLRGRVGFALSRALVYGTGGFGFANVSDTVCTGTCVTNSKTRTGFVVGGGVEYAVWDSLSLKLEFLHADFSNKNYFDPPAPNGATTVVTRRVNLTDDMVRAGINWRFYSESVAGEPAVAAKN